MNDLDKKTKLPIHVVFGAIDYTKMKVQEIPRVEQFGEPVAELTRFGWVLISSGKEAQIEKLMCM